MESLFNFTEKENFDLLCLLSQQFFHDLLSKLHICTEGLFKKCEKELIKGS